MDMRLTNPTHWTPQNNMISIQDHLTFDHPTTQPWPNSTYYPNHINDLPDPRPPVGEMMFGGRNCQFKSENEVVVVVEEEEEEVEEEEELGAMKEMMFKMAAMQPVDIDPASVRRPRRRNVRISDDPQSVAARRRRERISERMRILQRLVPGGTKMDTASMLDEAVRYLKFLKRQIRLLQAHPRRPQMPGYSHGDDVAGSGGGCGGGGMPHVF